MSSNAPFSSLAFASLLLTKFRTCQRHFLLASKLSEVPASQISKANPCVFVPMRWEALNCQSFERMYKRWGSESVGDSVMKETNAPIVEAKSEPQSKLEFSEHGFVQDGVLFVHKEAE